MKPRVFLPAVASGLLLWAAFFPLNLGFLAFVALVPWLSLVRADVSRRRRYFAAYVGGVTFFLPALQWVRVAHPMMHLSWVGMSLMCPLYWCVALFLLRRIDRLKCVPFALAVPVVWVALEYVRAHFPTGFSFLQHVGLYQLVGFGWYFLGYTQHEFAPLIQIADVGGVYAVSFVVGAVNGLVLDWLARPVVSPRPRFATLAVVALFAGSVVYGFAKLTHAPFAEGPRVAAIQASVPQSDKMDQEKTGDLFDKYDELCRTAAASGVDLVVWPETCYPYGWWTIAPNLDPKSVPTQMLKTAASTKAALKFFATGKAEGFIPNPNVPVPPPWKTNVLIGTNGYEWDGNRSVPTNTAVLVNADGDAVGRYDKMHLVPFGEYVPFRETLPWMQNFTPYKDDYSCRPGESYTRFEMKARDRVFRFGCLICYEDSDPYLARQYVAEKPVDFLVNISNDGWFDGTEEHEQHLAICRFRAVEARRSVVRAVNMGISAVIDPDGRVIALPGPTWSKSKKTDGIVTATVPLDTRESLYARLGDWVPAACWALLTVGHVAGITQRRRAKQGTS
ncbi:MAG TPA: apolipoprotein N-acyltransferase [Gemmataceae bacterium]|nr:apolipoprotein N-acyltransferase [Gemmataceae bacterium]